MESFRDKYEKLTTDRFLPSPQIFSFSIRICNPHRDGAGHVGEAEVELAIVVGIGLDAERETLRAVLVKTLGSNDALGGSEFWRNFQEADAAAVGNGGDIGLARHGADKVGISRGDGRVGAVFRVVGAEAELDLVGHGASFSFLGRADGALHGGKSDARKNGQNSDDDEEFDQRKAGGLRRHGAWGRGHGG
jgi:hypothetical protein